MRASALATWVSGVLHGPDVEVEGVAPVEKAGPTDLAFLLGPRPPAGCRAGVLLATRPLDGWVVVVVDDPKLAFILVLRRLFPEVLLPGVAPGAHVHPSAQVHPSAVVFPGAYVGARARIGAEAVLFPNAVVLDDCEVGPRCRVGPGAVVGYAGFGVHPTADGLVPVPQVGRVVLEEGVNLGANTCVDRAFLETTWLGRDTHVDNLVQIGHNCQVGPSAVLVAQVGLSGSVTVGPGAVLAGQVGVADHVTIGPGAQVGAQAGLHHDVPAGARQLGTPAEDARLTARIWASLKELPDLVRRVRRLERAARLANPSPPLAGGTVPGTGEGE